MNIQLGNGITKFQLFSLLAYHGTPTLSGTVNGKLKTYILQGITRESGCGHTFILSVLTMTTNEKQNLFVRTID